MQFFLLLQRFRHLLAVKMRNHDRQRHRQHHAQYNEDDIIADGVAEHVDGGFLVIDKQELEVLTAAPLAIVKQAPQKALAGSHLVFLEGDDQPEHGQIAEQDIPHQRGQRKEKQLHIVQRKLPFLSTGPAFFYGTQQPRLSFRSIDSYHALINKLKYILYQKRQSVNRKFHFCVQKIILAAAVQVNWENTLYLAARVFSHACQLSAWSFRRKGNKARLSRVGYTRLVSSSTQKPVSGSTSRLVPVKPVWPKQRSGTQVLKKQSGLPAI